MHLSIISQADDLWEQAKDYAKTCSWKAGAFLAKLMNENGFEECERVIVAIENNTIIGFCTVTKKDSIPNVTYSPYIGFIFVDENYRGKRISEKMISYAISYIKELKFEKVYLVSDHINLYEKYGFNKIDERTDFWGNIETIFVQDI